MLYHKIRNLSGDMIGFHAGSFRHKTKKRHYIMKMDSTFVLDCMSIGFWVITYLSDKSLSLPYQSFNQAEMTATALGHLSQTAAK